MKRKRLFFDLDGTMAEWRASASEEDLYRKGYFASLAPTEAASYANALAESGERADVCALSSYLTGSYALGEKNAWCDSHTPAISREHRLFVPYGENKAEFVMLRIRRRLSKDDILIDDHTPNLIEWEKAGGRAIKWLNGINGRNGTFKGTRAREVRDLEEAIFG